MDMDDHTQIVEEATRNGSRTPAPQGIILPVDHAQAILDYLQNCRYADVHELVGYLLTATPTSPPEDTSDA